VLAALPSLRKLDISSNNLNGLPKEISNMNSWWAQFDPTSTADSKIAHLPGFLKLESLDFSSNTLSNPEEFFDIVKDLSKYLTLHPDPLLKRLSVRSTGLTTVDFLSKDTETNKKIPGFYFLEEIDISQNKIDTIPGLMGVTKLPNLKTIHIANNPITLNKNPIVVQEDGEGTMHHTQLTLSLWTHQL
jgi:Leucine-rich repeat (LRR) protein